MTTREKPLVSHVVKVTGMSEELLALLDARVKEQHAAGRAEYIRELIRRDVLPGRTPPSAAPSPEEKMLDEYHALVDRELEGRLSPAQAARLREVETLLDRSEARQEKTQAMFARLEETAGKLDALLAAVQALPKAQAGE